MAKSSSDLPLYLFHEGTNFHAQDFLGAHPVRRGRGFATVFRVWCPRARSVSVVGDFNAWDRTKNPMKRKNDGEVWECVTPGRKRFDLYKYSIETADGRILLKADPFAFHAQRPPETASAYEPLEGYEWGDAEWMARRRTENPHARPVNIYEVHLGSWRRYPDGNYFDYEKLGAELSAYAARMGYTHIELLPVMEHPYDGSWGYQITGFFAPTSRYGTAQDFMKFVDICHRTGIGVILDWVGGHFPKDAHGLFEFDGAPLFEYADPRKGEQNQWGTRVFDFGRPEVRSFLISNALFWAERYHIDGLRMDAVASMLYLDFGRRPGDWTPNREGGRENLEAVELIRALNTAVHKSCPDVMLIAEESTSWPMVTGPAAVGGLGFDFKWNMGWMNDSLFYTSLDPVYRAYNHDKLTFGMFYAYSERFILPVSHDEVVHGKRSLIGRMPGDYWKQFAGARAFLGYMTGHPGKKLNFMGNELAQFIEWDYRKELDWLLLGYESHRRFQDYVRDLNRLYLETPALWEIDDGWEGFEWLVLDDNTQNILCFLRRGEKGDGVVCLLNFAPVLREGYRIGLARAGTLTELFNSDSTQYGGTGAGNPEPVTAEDIPMHGKDWSVSVTVPPLSAVFFAVRWEEDQPAVKAALKTAEQKAKTRNQGRIRGREEDGI